MREFRKNIALCKVSVNGNSTCLVEPNSHTGVSVDKDEWSLPPDARIESVDIVVTYTDPVDELARKLYEAVCKWRGDTICWGSTQARYWQIVATAALEHCNSGKRC